MNWRASPQVILSSFSEEVLQLFVEGALSLDTLDSIIHNVMYVYDINVLIRCFPVLSLVKFTCTYIVFSSFLVLDLPSLLPVT